MDEEELRRTLLWLIEINDRPNLNDRLLATACGTCGHDRSAHVVGGDADNPTPWPCDYPKILGAPHGLCRCRDYDPIKEVDVDPKEKYL